MKKLLLFVLLLQFLFITPLLGQQQEAQEQLGLPGDNLNLYAVLKLFTESPTLEGFEKSLNDENSNINNLDLDGDNNIDYIRVEDNAEGNLHNIVLKVALGDNESQDVAVIVVQKIKDGDVEIQVIGNEDLYGENYVIEPNYSNKDASAETPNPGYMSQVNTGSTVVVQTTTTYQVASWPLIRFIFRPSYVIWRSPWYWHHYPSYWRPWRPHYWHYYYGYHYHWNYYYYGHYRYWPHYRYPNWHNYYYGGRFRSRSTIFQTRFSRGDYRATYGRPDLARQGAAVFVKKYPKAPSANAKLPTFDKGGTNRPIVTRPARLGEGLTRPTPGRPSVEKPVTKPVRPTPNPGVTKPITKPTPTPRPTKPVTKPTQPVTRPVTPKPTPEPRPTRPAPSKPAPKKTRDRPVH